MTKAKKTAAGLLLAAIPFLTACPSETTSEEDIMRALLLSQVGPQFVLFGNWTDTTDSNAKYSITNTGYVHLEYLGSGSPKTDYSMSILSYSNTGGTFRLSGLQLNFAGWPTIATQTNTIYQRIRFAKTDADTFYYCQEVSNKNTAAELDADTTSFTFTSSTGATCNGFTWSKMTRR